MHTYTWVRSTLEQLDVNSRNGAVTLRSEHDGCPVDRNYMFVCTRMSANTYMITWTYIPGEGAYDDPPKLHETYDFSYIPTWFYQELPTGPRSIFPLRIKRKKKRKIMTLVPLILYINGNIRRNTIPFFFIRNLYTPSFLFQGTTGSLWNIT